MRKYPVFLMMLLIPFTTALAQPIAVSDLPVGSKLTYRLTGVYVGNKTYEVVGWSSSEGRRCKLVRVHVQVNASGSFFYKGINSTSEFCYDDRGRPLSEVLRVPPEFNLSVDRVSITYWWEDEETFPYRTLIQLMGQENTSYEVLLKEGLIIKRSDGSEVKLKFTGKNLSKVLPFTPERLSEPYLDLSSIRLKEGYEKDFGTLKVKVISLENVQTPAGLFPCFKVIITGNTEDGLPYKSTVYVTQSKPRFTVYYITNIIGIEQTGYLLEARIPEAKGAISSLYYWLIPLFLAAVAFLLIKKRKKRGG